MVSSSLLEEILNVCLNSANAQYNSCSRYHGNERVERVTTSARAKEAIMKQEKAMLRRLSFLLSMFVLERTEKKKTKYKA